MPDVIAQDLDGSRRFYRDCLGFEVGMDMGRVINFISTDNPTARVIVIREDQSADAEPDMTVEVEDVDQVHDRAEGLDDEIVHPLTNEPGCPPVLRQGSERQDHQSDVPHYARPVNYGLYPPVSACCSDVPVRALQDGCDHVSRAERSGWTRNGTCSAHVLPWLR
ncbi:MAG TPA: VOC family protein [Nitriliruptorales bacterium]|nr:VOC family protein [Nitriliruptorales bacterium]